MVSRPPRRHRVAGVDHQVHDDLLDVGRIGQHQSQLGRGQRHQLDVFAHDASHHLVDARQHLVEIDDLGRHHLLSAEDQQLTRQLGGAQGGGVDLFQALRDRTSGLGLADQQLAVTRARPRAGC